MRGSGYQWVFRPEPPDELIHDISRQFKLSGLAAAILYDRLSGDLSQAEAFLQGGLSQMTDPAELPGVTSATQLLVQAATAGFEIGIFGDYDADGITGSALLGGFLRRCGIKINVVIPDRSDGYGLTVRAVRQFAEQGTQMIITVDNGVAAVDAAAEARRVGISLIVTDHHRIGPQLPDADVIVHPGLDDYHGQWSLASGAGVALALVISLRRALRELGWFREHEEPNLTDAMQLAAIGTVADLVPIHKVNRLIVREGLQRLQTTCHPGLVALLEAAGVDPATMDAETIGFVIGPRVNAAGRVGRAGMALECLLASRPDQAKMLAGRLEDANMARRRVQDQITERLREHTAADPQLAAAPALVAAHPDWSHGVLGIVAGKLTEELGKPAILLQIQGQYAKGSARGVPGLDLMVALEPVRHLCDTLGGHAEAAGMTVPVANLAEFRQLFFAGVVKQADQLGPPQLLLEQTLPLSAVDVQLVDEIARFAPFGMGNPAPVFASDFVNVASARILKEKHLALRFGGALRHLTAIGFGQAHRYALTQSSVQLAYRPARDHWRGGDAVQLMVQDLRPGSL